MTNSYGTFKKDRIIKDCELVLELIEKERIKDEKHWSKIYAEDCEKAIKKYNSKFKQRFLRFLGIESKILTYEKTKDVPYYHYIELKSTVVIRKLLELAKSSDSEDILISSEDWNLLANVKNSHIV